MVRHCARTKKSILTLKHEVLIHAAGVSAVAMHPIYSFLVAIGLKDGTVLVADLKQSTQFSTENEGLEHLAAVLQVVWLGDQLTAPHLFSISADGTLIEWVLEDDHLTEKRTCFLLEDQFFKIISCIDLTADQRYCAILGSINGTVATAGLTGAGESVVHRPHTRTITHICWNKKIRNYYLTSCIDWTVSLCRVSEDKVSCVIVCSAVFHFTEGLIFTH